MAMPLGRKGNAMGCQWERDKGLIAIRIGNNGKLYGIFLDVKKYNKDIKYCILACYKKRP